MDRLLRRLIAFECEGDDLVGSCDAADGATGVLIVSDGNEPRSGAHRWQASLAQALAACGAPTFRYDRRGVGDSSGKNHGWETSGPDIAAAVAAFCATQPHVERIVGIGNCDAATALALFGTEAGIDAVVLANPWLGDDSPLPPPAAIRARYLRRLASPPAWWRLLTGRGGWRKLAAGLRRAASRAAPPPTLAARVAAALAGREATIVLARGDRTAQVFRENWRGEAFAAIRPTARVIEVDSNSHSFVGQQASLVDAILSVIDRGRPSRE